MATLSPMKYRITLIESEESWAVWCDDLPGRCSQGGTREEAVENTRIAIAEYLDARRKSRRVSAPAFFTRKSQCCERPQWLGTF